MAVCKGLLVKGLKLVIPLSLQDQVVKLAHQGHQGLTKTKHLLRSKVWFPKLDSKVCKEVGTCEVCHLIRPTEKQEPLQMSTLPEKPWENLAVDFCGPLESGAYLMVVVDECTRYPVVVDVFSTSAQAVIPELQKIFGIFGLPKVLKSDNGPPFFWTRVQGVFKQKCNTS